MPKNQNKPQNQKYDLNQHKLANSENQENYKSEEIELVEKDVSEENAKDEIFKNIHTKPADEQQFENNTLDSNNTK